MTGIRPTLQFVDQLLGKQLFFYAGILKNPWPTAADGSDRYFKAQHRPMISEEEMLRIQAIKGGKTLVKHNRYNPLFPLRRLVLCQTCQHPLTGSSPRSRNGKKHDYYHCYNAACPMKGKAIGRDIIGKHFEEYLKRITPTDEFFAFFREVVLDLWKSKQEKLTKEADQYRRAVEEIEGQRKNIFYMRECGIYTDDQFRERIAEADNRVAAAKISLSETRIEQFDIEGAMCYAEQFIRNLSRQWRELPHALRPRFQRLVFPEGIPYDRKSGFGTAKVGSIFRLNERQTSDKSALVDSVRIYWNQLLLELLEYDRLRVCIREHYSDHAFANEQDEPPNEERLAA
jgi:hypothetical protein